MNGLFRRVALTAQFALALAAAGCGGGGGGDSGGSPPPPTPPAASVRLEGGNSITVSGSPNGYTPEEYRRVLVTGSFPDGLYIRLAGTFRGVAWIGYEGQTLEELRLRVRFKPPAVYPNGTYTDQLELGLCYDQACNRPVPGSPLNVSVTYSVSGSPATVTPATLSPPVQGQLGHDVIDAAISRPLNLVVMASSQPSNALYLYDLSSRTERKVALPKPPNALTLSADGTKAAVGHDALVSYVDLAAAGPTGVPNVQQLNVSADVYSLLLDGSGHVQVIPQTHQWVDLHTLDIATNTETLQQVQMLFGRTRLRMHPMASAFYALDTALSPPLLARLELSGGAVTSRRQTPYWGDYTMCGNLWLDDAGGRIFTACGNTFAASDDPSADMLYAGRLPLTDSSPYLPSVVSVSDSSAANETVALDAGTCASFAENDCETLVRVYERDHLNLVAADWLMPIPMDGAFRPQHGMFVFHAADGSRWTISRLASVDDATKRYYLTRRSDSAVMPR